MTAFHDVQFQPDISYGASGGPGYSTGIVTTVSGQKRRNANRAMARGRWNVTHGPKKRGQVGELIASFRARRGRASGFLFKDWTDCQALAQSLGVGDGSRKTFQLVKHGAIGGVLKTRLIAKPVAGRVEFYRDGIKESSGWSVDTTAGLVTFGIAAAAGIQVAADVAFDVPVRFDSDQMDPTIETYQLASRGGRLGRPRDHCQAADRASHVPGLHGMERANGGPTRDSPGFARNCRGASLTGTLEPIVRRRASAPVSFRPSRRLGTRWYACLGSLPSSV